MPEFEQPKPIKPIDEPHRRFVIGSVSEDGRNTYTFQEIPEDAPLPEGVLLCAKAAGEFNGPEGIPWGGYVLPGVSRHFDYSWHQFVEQLRGKEHLNRNPHMVLPTIDRIFDSAEDRLREIGEQLDNLSDWLSSSWQESRGLTSQEAHRLDRMKQETAAARQAIERAQNP